MPPRREDVAAYLAEVTKAREREHVVELGLLKTASVHAEKLVGTPEWDAYQRHLQGLIEQAEQQVLALTQQLVNPLTPWDSSLIGMIRGTLALWQGRRDAFKEALLLPHEAIRAYREGTHGKP